MGLSLNDAKIAMAVLAGESVASFVCDMCGWVDEFEVSTALLPACPYCQKRGNLIVENI